MYIKPNPEFKYILASYEDALNMPIVDGTELIRIIEKDLENLGDDAIIAGKDTLLDFYQNKLNKMVLNAPAYKTCREQWVEEIRELNKKISRLEFEIELLSGVIENPELDHPAMQKLQSIVKGMTGIESARLIYCQKVVFTGIEARKIKEYAIEITAESKDSVVFWKKDLAELLELLSKNNID